MVKRGGQRIGSKEVVKGGGQKSWSKEVVKIAGQTIGGRLRPEARARARASESPGAPPALTAGQTALTAGQTSSPLVKTRPEGRPDTWTRSRRSGFDQRSGADLPSGQSAGEARSARRRFDF